MLFEIWTKLVLNSVAFNLSFGYEKLLLIQSNSMQFIHEKIGMFLYEVLVGQFQLDLTGILFKSLGHDTAIELKK